MLYPIHCAFGTLCLCACLNSYKVSIKEACYCQGVNWAEKAPFQEGMILLIDESQKIW